MTIKCLTISKRVIMFIAAFLISMTSSNAIGDSVYTRGAYLNEALFHLKLVKSLTPDAKVPYDPQGFYKVDMDYKKIEKADKREYFLNSIIASPDGKWYFEKRNILSDCRGNKKYVDLPEYILSYAWSPKSDKIVYVTGDYSDDYTPPRKPGSNCKYYCPDPGVWIYDLKSGGKTKIDFTGYNLAWPAFDDNIYIQTAFETIYRYRTETGKVESTPYKSLSFSPGGKYYFMPSHEGEPIRIYQREPHQELKSVSTDLNNLAFNVLHDTLTGYLWLADDHSLLFPSNKPGQSVIYDIESGKLTKTLPGMFLGVNKSKNKILVMKGVNEFEVINYNSNSRK